MRFTKKTRICVKFLFCSFELLTEFSTFPTTHVNIYLSFKALFDQDIYWIINWILWKFSEKGWAGETHKEETSLFSEEVALNLLGRHLIALFLDVLSQADFRFIQILIFLRNNFWTSNLTIVVPVHLKYLVPTISLPKFIPVKYLNCPITYNCSPFVGRYND